MDHHDDSKSNLTITVNDDDDASPSGSAAPVELSSSAVIYDKSQSLVEIANNTFRELCKTLESEQSKLLDLEERRKKLQEEMLRLKAEIEGEKQAYQLNFVQSVADSLKTINTETVNEFDGNFNHLKTCYEEDENNTTTSRNMTEPNCKEINNDESSIEEQTIHIKYELQNVLEQCISEQNQSIDSNVGVSSKTEFKAVQD